MPQKKVKELPVPAFQLPGMKYAELRLTPVEDEHEQALRLHKERLSFWVKDIGTYVFAALVLLCIAILCFWKLTDKSTTPEELRYAWAAISAIMGGIVGTVFGKSTK
jgi:hypothetical protein